MTGGGLSDKWVSAVAVSSAWPDYRTGGWGGMGGVPSEGKRRGEGGVETLVKYRFITGHH